MNFDQNEPEFAKLAQLICPGCGGKLLRGPAAGTLNHNLTCRDCTALYYVAITTTEPFRSPRDDAEFITTVSVLAWERIGSDVAGAAFFDPRQPVRHCDYCNTEYTGSGVYCCAACAIADNKPKW